MFPGLPSSTSGAYVIETVTDEECAANLVTHRGEPYGVWLDDSTPNLDHWLSLAVAKYDPLNQTVFVCIPPGRPRLRHMPSPPIVNVQEWYPYGMGVPPSAWGKPPAAEAFCVQWLYPGTAGKRPPTLTERAQALAAVKAHDPKYIFLF